MKNLFKLAVLSSALALTSVSVAHAEEKIGFLDANYVFQIHPARKALENKIKTDLKTQIDNVLKQEKTILDKRKALEKDAPKLRAVEIKKREEEINKLNNTYLADAKDLQAKINTRLEEGNSKIIEDINGAVAKAAKQGNYTLVLDASTIAYAANGKDLTDEVVKNLDHPAPLPANTQENPKP